MIRIRLLRPALVVAKRLLLAACAYAATVLALAAVLNGTFELTIRSQIREDAGATIRAMSAADFAGEDPVLVRERLVEAQERAFGLHRPVALRLLARWLAFLRWDFGRAYRLSVHVPGEGPTREVSRIILANLPPTLVLFVLSTGLALVLGTLLGAWKARHAGSRGDRASSLLAMLLFGTPAWWVASIAVLVFVYELRLLPFGALASIPPPEGALARLLDRASYLLLPVATLTFVRTWGVAFLVRPLVMEPLQEDYVMAARGRGIPEAKVFLRHGLRVAAPGVATQGFGYLLASLGGDILVEISFGRPGLGTLLWQAVRSVDVPVSGAILAAASAFSCLGYAVLDLARGALDPRLRRD